MELMNEEVSGKSRYFVPLENVNSSGMSAGVKFPEVSIKCPECGHLNTWELDMDRTRKQPIIGAMRI